MSKHLPDPQIVQLKAMRRGDIAIALPSPSTIMIGVSPFAAPSPLVLPTVTLVPAVPTLPATAGLLSQTAGPVGEASSTSVCQNGTASIGLSGAGSFPEISFTLETADTSISETAGPVGVGTGTSVV